MVGFRDVYKKPFTETQLETIPNIKSGISKTDFYELKNVPNRKERIRYSTNLTVEASTHGLQKLNFETKR